MAAMPFLRFLKDNWNFLLAGALLTFTSAFGQVFFISVFAEEIMAEAGIGDAGWGLLYTAATGTSAAIMVFAGRFNDRYRTRTLSLVILTGLALSCILMAFAQTVPLLYLTVLGLRFFGQGMTMQLGILAMQRWYVAQRGRATAIAMLGFAVGQALTPLALVKLKSLTDWHNIWLGSAVVIAVMILALQLLLRRERAPRTIAEEISSPGMGGRHWSQGEVVRHPLIWMLLPAIVAPSATTPTLFFQQVHLAQVRGWVLADYLALLPVFTVSSLTCALFGGWLVDRIGAQRLVRVTMLPFALAFAAIATFTSLPGVALGLVLMGVGTGIGGMVLTNLLADLFGTRHLGAIRGFTTSFMVLGTALGPGFSGVAIGWGWAYPQQCVFYALFCLVAGASVIGGMALYGPRAGGAKLPDAA